MSAVSGVEVSETVAADAKVDAALSELEAAEMLKWLDVREGFLVERLGAQEVLVAGIEKELEGVRMERARIKDGKVGEA